tara:strand:- start:2938 stop:3084 length:147 start_codon:yes stop_codon:yes gene_type:complete
VGFEKNPFFLGNLKHLMRFVKIGFGFEFLTEGEISRSRAGKVKEHLDA